GAGAAQRSPVVGDASAGFRFGGPARGPGAGSFTQSGWGLPPSGPRPAAGGVRGAGGGRGGVVGGGGGGWGGGGGRGGGGLAGRGPRAGGRGVGGGRGPAAPGPVLCSSGALRGVRTAAYRTATARPPRTATGWPHQQTAPSPRRVTRRCCVVRSAVVRVVRAG